MGAVLIFFVNFVCVLPSTVITLSFVCKTAQMKNPRKYIFTCVCVGYVCWILNNYILPSPSSLIEFMTNLAWSIMTFCWAKPKQRLIAVLSFIVYLGDMFLSVFALSMLVSRLAYAWDISFASMGDAHTLTNALMSIISTCVIFPTQYLCYRVLRFLLNRRTLPEGLLLFLPVPISQAILVNVVLRLTPYSYQIADIRMTMAAGILFSIAADICFFMCISKMRKASQLKNQIRMAEEQLNTQTAYYRQLQDNILTVNQIRHDLSNQLQAAYHLLEKGEQGQARKQLDVLQESIREQVGPSYSNNLMVDAVLTEKAKSCREKGIQLSLAVEIPSKMSIENAHLCSAFSNILDNSICGALESGCEEPYIRLNAVVQKGYLTIRCVNSAVPPQRDKSSDPLRRHGLGLDILGQLAKQYHGNLETSCHAGAFDLTLILRIDEV